VTGHRHATQPSAIYMLWDLQDPFRIWSISYWFLIAHSFLPCWFSSKST